jgi:parallel beta-helix repeat protein
MSGFKIILGLLLFISTAAAYAGPVYYVSAAGNDSNNGLSPATAWRTVNKVNATVRTTGADVYFRAGDTWNNQQLNIRWGGTASDPAIVGAYHVSNGAVRFNQGDLRKPEINGTFESACRQARNCQLDNRNAVPSSTWAGLVVIAGSNVTVENLRLRDSAGAAVTFEHSSTRRNIVIQNLDIAHWARAIINAKNVQSIVIRNNVANGGNYCDRDDYTACAGVWWAAGIYISDSRNAHALLENNTVTQNYGEGVSCMRSSHVIIRGNRVGNLRSTGLYLDNCSHSVVEQNIAWSDPTRSWHWRGSGQEGIGLAVEDYRSGAMDSVGNIIRNNLVAGTGSCIRVDMDSASKEQGRRVGAKIYGNTCMGNQSLAFNNFLSDRNVDRLEVRNNIFHSGTSGVCRNNSPNSASFRNNVWNQAPGSNCSGSGQVVADPRVQGSGWTSKSFDNPPRVADFQLRSDSPARLRGMALGAPLTLADNLPISSRVAMPCRTFDKNELRLDYRCTVRPSTPNIGALEDGSTSSPQAPVLWY